MSVHRKTPRTTRPLGGVGGARGGRHFNAAPVGPLSQQVDSGHHTTYPEANYSHGSAGKTIKATVIAGSKPWRQNPFSFLCSTAEISATKLPSWEGANNIRIWRTKDPHAAILHIRDSPKLNVTSRTRWGSVTLPPPRPRLPYQRLPQSWIGRTTHYHHPVRDYLISICTKAGSDARPHTTRR